MGAISADLRKMLLGEGASLIGYAEMGPVYAVCRDWPYGVSVAVALPRDIAAQIQDGPTPAYYAAYERINDELARLCGLCVDFLKERGYRASTTSPTIRAKGDMDPIPHKTAATRSGLGWIGKSALLVTREYGPAIRLGTVLTDAPLDTGTPVTESSCGTCTECVRACPGRAIRGENWRIGCAREELYDVGACRTAARAQAGRIGVDNTICGICIGLCPWTKGYIRGR
mgnify:CR=1 FL=1